MSTVDEMLAEQLAEGENPVCVIDAVSRKINMHEDFRFFGVENDKKVERVKFRCAKEVGDEKLDLTTCQKFIVYTNANGEPGMYEISDLVVDGDNVTFTWLLDEDVTLYKGNVKFIFYACKLAGDEIDKAWNTTPAFGTVEEGMDAVERIEASNPAILESMLLRIAALEMGGSGNTGASSMLVVKIDFDTNAASHSASEIRNAFRAGKVVVTTDEYGMMLPLYDGLSEVVVFEVIYESNGLKKAVIEVAENKNATFYTTAIASAGAPASVEVELLADNWIVSENSASMFYQPVNIDGVTENSKVDLTLTPEQILEFEQLVETNGKELTLIAENDGVNIRVFAIGQKLEKDYVIQATITEVSV